MSRPAIALAAFGRLFLCSDRIFCLRERASLMFLGCRMSDESHHLVTTPGSASLRADVAGRLLASLPNTTLSSLATVSEAPPFRSRLRAGAFLSKRQEKRHAAA